MAFKSDITRSAIRCDIQTRFSQRANLLKVVSLAGVSSSAVKTLTSWMSLVCILPSDVWHDYKRSQLGYSDASQRDCERHQFKKFHIKTFQSDDSRHDCAKTTVSIKGQNWC